MSKRIVEVFVAGCPCCDEAVNTVRSTTCENCDIQVLDMRSDVAAQAKAKSYGIHRVPAVVVDGKLVECCQSGPVDVTALRAAGVGGG